jgi:hypothetical protein
VLPVSKIVLIDRLVVEDKGGPSELAVCKKSGFILVTIFGVTVGFLLGSPLVQLVAAGVEVGVLRSGGTNTYFHHVGNE